MPRARLLSSILIGFVVLANQGVLAAGTALHLEPALIETAPGEEFDVFVEIPAVGDPINGYDAVIGFDSDRLELMLPVPASAGEGALFTTACPQRFLSVGVAPDSVSTSIAHVILCAGTSVTGPGTLYRLRFRARGLTGSTDLELLDGTAAYEAGSYVTPLSTSGATVVIGGPTAAPPAPRGVLDFHATPNPFNPRTELVLESTEVQQIRIELFTLAGRSVATLYDGLVGEGPFRTVFDGRDRSGRRLSSGSYLARLTSSNGSSVTTRLVLLR